MSSGQECSRSREIQIRCVRDSKLQCVVKAVCCTSPLFRLDRWKIMQFSRVLSSFPNVNELKLTVTAAAHVGPVERDNSIKFAEIRLTQNHFSSSITSISLSCVLEAIKPRKMFWFQRLLMPPRAAAVWLFISRVEINSERRGEQREEHNKFICFYYYIYFSSRQP